MSHLFSKNPTLQILFSKMFIDIYLLTKNGMLVYLMEYHRRVFAFYFAIPERFAATFLHQLDFILFSPGALVSWQISSMLRI